MTKVVYGGWTFPDGERHLPAWMKKMGDKRDGRLLYQGSKYRAAMKYPVQKRGVIDVGAHVGLWSWQFAKDFERVIAFEPMPEHVECFKINTEGQKNIILHPCALGEKEGIAHMHVPDFKGRLDESSGGTGIDPHNASAIRVPMHRLDEFELTDIDFLKVDCEGFELFVMRGAVDTIKRNKPVIIIEQKPENEMTKNFNIGVKDGVELLKSLGYVERAVLAGDHIMTMG